MSSLSLKKNAKTEKKMHIKYRKAEKSECPHGKKEI
jgi:hypothetical protein